MSSALIRVEGINLSAVLDDTDDISVFRGASMLLRQAVKDLTSFKTTNREWSKQLKAISIGASIGLYRYSGDSVDKTCEKIATYLNKHENYRHFTFAVASETMADDKADFRRAEETLLAHIRFQQQKSISLAVPEESKTSNICEFDKLRPASEKEIPEETDKLKKRNHASASVRARFEFGRDQRQQFYIDELGLDKNAAPNFTTDLHELTDSASFSNLNDKMAVIYFDGNSFGKIQTTCKTTGDLKTWDDTIRGLRREYLKALLDMAKVDEHFRNGEKLQLETLLWGGDELMLVVPAWRGMKVLQHFYQLSDDWEHNNIPLRHAGGIVFCNRKTPIARIRKLARELADDIKELADKETQNKQYKTENYFDYLVLKSIDYPTQSLKKHFEQYYRNIPGRKPLKAIPNWESLLTEQEGILENIPRRQLQKLVQALTKGIDSPEYQQAQDRIRELMGDDDFAKAESLCAALFPEQDDAWQWVHLFELWDYIAPQPEAN
ncbi:MAG: hypothetical protein MJA28_06600 [Gammaproteobacteria bacterium]|nr:hypothetical protein [Gammaproteobacteria bacterium]